MKLEEKCIKPGQWLIEGYRATRTKSGRWQIVRLASPEDKGESGSLAGVRLWIAEQLEQRKLTE